MEQILLKIVKINIKTLFSLFDYIKLRNSDSDAENELYKIAECYFYMELQQIYSIIKLYEEATNPLLLDISSIYSLIRSLYEKVFIFNNIFVKPDDLFEKEVLFCIWKIHGLKNQKLPNNEKLAKKYEESYKNNCDKIERLKTKALDLFEKMNYNKTAKEKLEKIIKDNSTAIKGYKFISDNNQVIAINTISFTQGILELFPNEDVLAFYNYFSSYSHPSYLALYQFEQIYNSNRPNHITEFAIKTVLKLQICICNDMCSIFPDVNERFCNLPDEQKITLMNNNTKDES